MTEKRFRISQGYTDRFCHNWQNNQLLNFRETVDLLNELAEEKEYYQIKSGKCEEELLQLRRDNKQLKEENKELQERNNRQAKQLNDLYHLITEKDWRALTDILNDFKRNDEQLQKEWQTYDDEND